MDRAPLGRSSQTPHASDVQPHEVAVLLLGLPSQHGPLLGPLGMRVLAALPRYRKRHAKVEYHPTAATQDVRAWAQTRKQRGARFRQGQHRLWS
eukprot:CAMPEP_0115828908 /NCGR_PEP_ID=MMETSP0287-20121206/819_1 /TAXON_ID=412157 /ORGANISM="Chrysochromulina rotalis, Strain UIO044" /LENGTH=93 /DNA_ID=CAMNT_0003282145 /DNA_START=563 /DNA_END=844 /DNA_ORIENTATION=+